MSDRDNGVRRVVEGKNGLMVYDPENNPKVVDAVNEIRNKFLVEFEANPQLYIENDLKLIKSNDYFIRRFLYPHDLDPKPAYEQFRTWMQWRKDIGFEDKGDHRFPMEFFQIGALFTYRQDKQGTRILYMRFKVYKKLDILVEPIQRFVVYNMNKLDELGGRERSWAVLFDTRGAGIAQVDFDMLIFLVKTVKQYYPWGLKYVAIYELPWLLQGAWKITQNVLPEDATRLFKFYDRNSIKELIDVKDLPDFMDGECTDDYRAVPDGCQPAEVIGQKELGLSSQDVKKVIKHFEKHLKDFNQNSVCVKD